MDIKRFSAIASLIRPEERNQIASGDVFKLRPGLRFKLLALVILISLGTIVLSTFVLVNFQRRQLIANAESATAALSDTILASLHHAMHANDWDMVDEVLQVYTTVGAINKGSIVNLDGIVGVSSSNSEIGTRLLPTAAVCQACHANADRAAGQAVVLSTNAGQEVFHHVNLIPNQPECWSCHDPVDPFLGMLIIETPLMSVKDQLNKNLLGLVLLGLLTSGVLIGLIAPVLNALVLRPVESLSQGVAQISAGNLDYKVHVDKQDELGDLANSLNAMRELLKHSRAQMEQRERELGILNEVASAGTELVNLQVSLDCALQTVVNKLDLEAGLIYLQDDITGSFTLHTSYKVATPLMEGIAHCFRTGCAGSIETAEACNEVKVIDSTNSSGGQEFINCLHEHSFATIPLTSKGKQFGVMHLIAPPGQTLSGHTVEYLKLIGSEIGISIDNACLLADTSRREQEAATLYNLGTKISTSLNLAEVLNAVAEAARELLAADIGLVGLLDERREEIVMEAASGDGAQALIGLRLPVGAKSPGRVLIEGQPVMAEVYEPGQFVHQDDELLTNEKIVSFLAVPLERGEHVLGLVEVMTRQPRRFQERDAILLMRLAHQIVVSIENAQLHHQFRHLAALEERDRLGREMHDHLAQALGYLNVKAAMTSDLLSGGHIERAQESLVEMKNVVKTTYTDVRESIFNLRTVVSSRLGLLETLRDYLNDYRKFYALDAQLVIEDEDWADLPLEVATQVLCIIQEALTNVRKHAQATRVAIDWVQNAEHAVIQIEDNGIGFIPNPKTASQHQSYGLQIMQERALSIGGRLEFDSQPGRGTRLILNLPKNHKGNRN